MTEDTFFTCPILSVQGCVSQRYYAFALYASSCAICYNFRRCHGYMLAMPHFSHSIKFTCQLMRTPLVYKALATTLNLNDRIWTCNLLNPNQAHCQIVLHSDFGAYSQNYFAPLTITAFPQYQVLYYFCLPWAKELPGIEPGNTAVKVLCLAVWR